MRVLLLGATGMLGQELVRVLKKYKFVVVTSSRNNSDYNIDYFLESNRINEIISEVKPQIIINAVAIVNLRYCELNPDEAYVINSRLPSIITEICKNNNIYFIQISTDHYYSNEGKMKHCENYPVKLLNEYARTKYAGECLALTYEHSLVIRTNLVGFRNRLSSPTFIEWVLKSLEDEKEIVGYTDYYTSSIDVRTFSEILIDLIKIKYTGLINVASSEVISKYEFISSLASLLGKEHKVIKGQLLRENGAFRANSLGLDIKQLKKVLPKNKIPSSNEVIKKIYLEFKSGAYYELQK